jgi:hypothetical protein
MEHPKHTLATHTEPVVARHGLRPELLRRLAWGKSWPAAWMHHRGSHGRSAALLLEWQHRGQRPGALARHVVMGSDGARPQLQGSASSTR